MQVETCSNVQYVQRQHDILWKSGHVLCVLFHLLSQVKWFLWVKGSDFVCFSFPASQTCIQNILICLVTVFISLMFFTCYIWSQPYKIYSCRKILDRKPILLPTLIMDRPFQSFCVCSASSFFSVRICCLSLLFILTKNLWLWRGHYVLIFFFTILKKCYGPSCQINARFRVNHRQYLGALQLSVLIGDVWGIPLESLKAPNPRHHKQPHSSAGNALKCITGLKTPKCQMQASSISPCCIICYGAQELLLCSAVHLLKHRITFWHFKYF